MQFGLDRLSRLLLFAAIIAALVGASVSGTGRAQEASPTADCPTTTPEENKAIVEAYWAEQVWGDQGKIAEIVAPDEIHHWGVFDTTTGFDAWFESMDRFLVSFPDLRFTLGHQVAQGDLVASAWTVEGTHMGEWQGIAPTNIEATWEGINILRIECGMIAESWADANHLGLLAQLGAPDVPAFLAGTLDDATPVAEAVSEATPCAEDSPEANLDLVQRWTNELWTGQNLDVLNEIAAPEIVHHGGAFPDAHGVEAVMAGVSSQLAVFPDMNVAIDEAFAEDDLVAVRWSGTGTNEGEFLPGLAPTGQEIAISGVNIYQVNCGQIVESWSEVNGLSMLRQIQEAGAAATPAA